MKNCSLYGRLDSDIWLMLSSIGNPYVDLSENFLMLDFDFLQNRFIFSDNFIQNVCSRNFGRFILSNNAIQGYVFVNPNKQACPSHNRQFEWDRNSFWCDHNSSLITILPSLKCIPFKVILPSNQKILGRYDLYPSLQFSTPGILENLSYCVLLESYNISRRCLFCSEVSRLQKEAESIVVPLFGSTFSENNVSLTLHENVGFEEEILISLEFNVSELWMNSQSSTKTSFDIKLIDDCPTGLYISETHPFCACPPGTFSAETDLSNCTIW